jgi:peptide/nickel transport system permease protein
VLLWFFAVYFRWFPQFGNVDIHLNFGLDYIGSVLAHAVLPIIALSLSIFGESYLLLRGSSQEVLRSDYVLAAKSRGLGDRMLASAYILRNSLLPLVSIITFSLASLISRVVLVEAIFSYPGIGDLIVDAVRLHDYPVIEGSLFYLTVMVIIGGLIGDFLLLRLDPRLRT